MQLKQALHANETCCTDVLLLLECTRDYIVVARFGNGKFGKGYGSKLRRVLYRSRNPH
jgi:hypothetical protein